MFETITVPASLPSLFHNSKPLSAFAPLKYTLPSAPSTNAGPSSENDGRETRIPGFSGRVPAEVPSLIQAVLSAPFRAVNQTLLPIVTRFQMLLTENAGT